MVGRAGGNFLDHLKLAVSLPEANTSNFVTLESLLLRNSGYIPSVNGALATLSLSSLLLECFLGNT